MDEFEDELDEDSSRVGDDSSNEGESEGQAKMGDPDVELRGVVILTDGNRLFKRLGSNYQHLKARHNTNPIIRRSDRIRPIQLSQPHPSTNHALLVQSRGKLMGVPCTECAAGKGPFAECRGGLEEINSGACGGCVWSHTGSFCSYFHGKRRGPRQSKGDSKTPKRDSATSTIDQLAGTSGLPEELLHNRNSIGDSITLNPYSEPTPSSVPASFKAVNGAGHSTPGTSPQTRKRKRKHRHTSGAERTGEHEFRQQLMAAAQSSGNVSSSIYPPAVQSAHTSNPYVDPTGSSMTLAPPLRPESAHQVQATPGIGSSPSDGAGHTPPFIAPAAPMSSAAMAQPMQAPSSPSHHFNGTFFIHPRPVNESMGAIPRSAAACCASADAFFSAVAAARDLVGDAPPATTTTTTTASSSSSASPAATAAAGSLPFSVALSWPGAPRKIMVPWRDADTWRLAMDAIDAAADGVDVFCTYRNAPPPAGATHLGNVGGVSAGGDARPATNGTARERGPVG